VERRVTSFGPGRVNLIGEHTDYNQGLALPFAIAEGVTVRACALRDRRVAAVAVDLDERDAFSLDDVEPADGWRAFVRGAAAELARSGVTLVGADLDITGNVPRGAGLSSSAALEVALVLALLALAGAGEPDRFELARLCSRIGLPPLSWTPDLRCRLAPREGWCSCRGRIRRSSGRGRCS
jgi:galactokinase